MELTEKLKEELSARKEQYDYYRNKLLSFNHLETNNIETHRDRHTQRERERERERESKIINQLNEKN
jgi:hypothetical protein